ncbi:MAG: O-antigen ligase family protein [Patescibacteria group bacterium]
MNTRIKKIQRYIANHPVVSFAVAAILAGALGAFAGPVVLGASVLSAALLTMAIISPSSLLFVLALATPLEPFLLKFVPDEAYVFARFFSEGIIYLLAAVAALRVLRGRARIPKTPTTVPFLAFLAVAALSMLVNQVPIGVGLLGIRQIVRYVILFFAIVTLSPSRAVAQRILAALFVVVGFESVLGIAQAIFPAHLDTLLLPSERRFFESVQLTAGTSETWEPGTRVFGTLGRYDQLGTFLAFFLALAAGLLWERAVPVRRMILAAFFAAGGIALLLTQSRASWFGFALALFVSGFFLKRDRRVLVAAMLTAAVLLGALFTTGVQPRYLAESPDASFVERFFEAFSPARWRGEYDGLGRLYWAIVTPTVVVPASPVFGFGPGRFGGGTAAALHVTDVYDALKIPFGVWGTEGHVDNNWFAIWGEVGTLGLLAYALMVISLLRLAVSVFRTSKDPKLRGVALGYAGAVSAVIFQGFLGTYLEMRTLALYVWLIGAFLTVHENVERSM